MLRKLFAKLRTTLGSKNAPEKGKAAQPSAHPTTRRAQDQRGPKSQKSRSDESQGRAHQPRHDKGRGEGHGQKQRSEKTHGRGQGGRSSRDDHRGGPRGRHERGERHEPALTPRTPPAPPPDVPKMDTAFSKLGLNDGIAYAVVDDILRAKAQAAEL